MVVRTSPLSASTPSRPWNCDCALRLQKERIPPVFVMRLSANPEPVSNLPWLTLIPMPPGCVCGDCIGCIPLAPIGVSPPPFTGAPPAWPEVLQTDADHLVGFVVAITNDLVRLQLGHGNLDRAGDLLGRAPAAALQAPAHLVLVPDEQGGFLVVVGRAARGPAAPRLLDTLQAAEQIRLFDHEVTPTDSARPAGLRRSLRTALHEGVVTGVSTRLQRATSSSSSEYTRNSSVPPPMTW